MSLENALLGLLNHRPMTGYDLKRIFDDPMEFFWVAQMSQIYRELNKLEKNTGEKTRPQSISTYQRRQRKFLKLAKSIS